MLEATERLRRFLILADQGAPLRSALAEDLADFLVNWPAECPGKMHGPVMALFDMALAEAGEYELRRLAKVLVPVPELPLSALARIFALTIPAEQRRILNYCAHGPVEAPPKVVFHPDKLIAAARTGRGNFAPELAVWLQISPALAADILRDEAAISLAVLCKGALLGKARFSALSLILFQDLPSDPARLAVYDEIPSGAAMRLVGVWQAGRASSNTFSEAGEAGARQTG